ncbi:MAG: response regulator transcription factor [Alphaproteobacteria bacterium]|nr:response regulator transcription factor [Alphaproteobacteria bacterium]
MPRVLLVEEDVSDADATSAYLQKRGLHVEVAHEGVGVVERVWADPPDLLVLGVSLPGESGLSVCRRVRERYTGPIVIRTPQNDEIDQIVGLELGADDLVPKSASLRRLSLRIEVLLRRNVRSTRLDGRTDRYEDPHLVVDLGARVVSVRGQPVELTTGQVELLWLLVQHRGTPVSRDQYYEEIRGIRYDGLDRNMDSRMSQLRKALQDAGLPGERIRTVRGVGYQLTKID